MNRAIYPGSFDPITNGHYDIIKRCSKLFDEFIVLVMINPNKNSLFSIDERMEFIKGQCREITNVTVESYEGLLVKYASEKHCNVIVKGIRNTQDFQYEAQMALINKSLKKDIETFFIMSNPQYAHISSSAVKEISKLNGDLGEYVSKDVLESLNKLKMISQ